MKLIFKQARKRTAPNVKKKKSRPYLVFSTLKILLISANEAVPFSSIMAAFTQPVSSSLVAGVDPKLLPQLLSSSSTQYSSLAEYMKEEFGNEPPLPGIDWNLFLLLALRFLANPFKYRPHRDPSKNKGTGGKGKAGAAPSVDVPPVEVGNGTSDTIPPGVSSSSSGINAGVNAAVSTGSGAGAGSGFGIGALRINAVPSPYVVSEESEDLWRWVVPKNEGGPPLPPQTPLECVIEESELDCLEAIFYFVISRSHPPSYNDCSFFFIFIIIIRKKKEVSKMGERNCGKLKD